MANWLDESFIAIQATFMKVIKESLDEAGFSKSNVCAHNKLF